MIAGLQALLRWLFMHAEALFNRAFGDRLNPYYHLGAISFFLFWIVVYRGQVLIPRGDMGTGSPSAADRQPSGPCPRPGVGPS